MRRKRDGRFTPMGVMPRVTLRLGIKQYKVHDQEYTSRAFNNVPSANQGQNLFSGHFIHLPVTDINHELSHGSQTFPVDIRVCINITG